MEYIHIPGLEIARSWLTMKRITLILPDLIPGGAQRVFLNLAQEFINRGHIVEFVILTNQGSYMDSIPEGGRKVILCNRHYKIRLVTYIIAFFRMCSYFNRNTGNCFLSSLTGTNLFTLAAKLLSLRKIELYIREATVLNNVSSRFVIFLMRHLYPLATNIICVTQGIKQDLTTMLAIQENKLIHIANPVDINRIRKLSLQPNNHPWLLDKNIPVIVAVGRLVKPKGFDVLVKAIAKLNTRTPARLIIVGEGPLHNEFTRLIHNLNLQDRIDLVGYRDNPYNFIKQADLFVLSSNWEGFVNVLLEAMAIGTPVVATDCHSGPKEILKNGQLGTLVPVGDYNALAVAIQDNLNCVPDTLPLIKRVNDFALDKISQKYLDVITGTAETTNVALKP